MSPTRIVHGLLVLFAALLGASCSNRLGPYQDLLVGTPAEETPAPRGREVSITYLGVNGYLIRSEHTTIVADPYLTRFPLRTVMMNAQVAPCDEAIAYALQKGAFPRRVDGFLATHCHFDHLFDVPPLQRRLGGKVVTTATGMHLCEASRVPRRDISVSLPGSVHRIGEATVRVLPARHDKVFGKIPYPGLIDEPLSRPPDRPADWLLGTPLSFLIELHGKRIYLEAGAGEHFIPPVRDVDLAILGVALKESRERYPEAVRSIRPRYVLPSHQDSFFVPLRDGFQFSSVADFPWVKAVHESEALPGKMILMDYFQTWTLPD